MNFLVDAQLPPALARFLEQSGYQASHVMDVNLGNSDDTKIWEYAVKNQLVIITKDEDFAERILLNLKGPTIIWLRIGNCSKQTLLQGLAPLLKELEQKLQDGEKLIEIIG